MRNLALQNSRAGTMNKINYLPFTSLRFDDVKVSPQRFLLHCLLGAVFLLSLSSCSNQVLSTSSENIVVEFDWDGISRCLGRASPAMTFHNLPEETDSLKIKLRDVYFPIFPHGGGVIKYTGVNTFAQGEVSKARGHYIGPCTPPFFPGKYRFSVKALNDAGEVIGTGKSTQPFPHR